MNKQLKLSANWNTVKELLKEVNPNLTDDDLQYNPEKEDELLQRLALKMNRSEDHVRSWIESVSYNSGKAS